MAHIYVLVVLPFIVWIIACGLFSLVLYNVFFCLQSTCLILGFNAGRVIEIDHKGNGCDQDVCLQVWSDYQITTNCCKFL